jgi:hypothetical protein
MKVRVKINENVHYKPKLATLTGITTRLYICSAVVNVFRDAKTDIS